MAQVNVTLTGNEFTLPMHSETAAFDAGYATLYSSPELEIEAPAVSGAFNGAFSSAFSTTEAEQENSFSSAFSAAFEIAA